MYLHDYPFIEFYSFPICALMLVAMWFIFEKAGQPGWAILIPIYNIIVILDIIKKPWWWILLLLIPIVNIIIPILVIIELGHRFGKGTGFIIGMIFLPIIFYPILAFSDAKYIEYEDYTY